MGKDGLFERGPVFLNCVFPFLLRVKMKTGPSSSAALFRTLGGKVSGGIGVSMSKS